MRKSTGCGNSGHDKCPPMPACDIADSTSSFCKVTQFSRIRRIEETVVLGDFLIQILVEGDFKLPSYASDVKNIKKNVHLTQCKALPIPGVNNVVNLFVEGYIHKNIQYIDNCDGFIKDYSVEVPFSCFKRVELARPVVFPFGEFSVKENVRERRELAKDGMGADRCTFGSLTFEINNEPITCKLLASAVNQLDILQNFDKWGRFNKVTEKADVLLAIKLTQKQVVSRLLYVSSFGTRVVQIYNISNPRNPVRIGEFNGANLNNPSGLAITGNILYVANPAQGNNAVEVYDISNPIAPVHVGEFNQGNLRFPDQLAINGNILYVANGIGNHIEIYNISNPVNPVRLGEFNGDHLNGPSGLIITDNLLYVANFNVNTVEIYDITNPTNPVHAGQFNAGNLDGPAQFAITGTTLYVANVGDDTVEIYDISNPLAPVRKGEFNSGNLDGPAILAITGNTLYVANSEEDTVEIYDISNPLAPVREGEFGTGELDFPNGMAILTLLC
ncbi:hypothetical protein P2R12_08205 [Cytobacillus oceanisediminis]|uniref:LVIVD repeat-containing protein n=1 Tax=Cytobacillus oceanisediminis TaxID=665099 RepID=UPI0023DCC937|nr:hypothetical protein [Cytobacillus oceanisediminis]MDF2036956.1 hypothetical protein [Cytobacillus oceanisediminis]